MIKPKKKLSVGNNIGNNIVNNNNIQNNNPKHNRRQSSNIIGRITLKEDTKNKIFNTVKDNSVKTKKMNRHSLFLENNNIKKNLLLNENNNYDENRIKNYYLVMIKGWENWPI